MPFTVRDNVRLHWIAEGDPDLQTLVLLNSIGTDWELWDGVAPLLLPHFRVLRVDTRGHGASDAPGGDYTLAILATDVVAQMDSAGITTASVAGVSLGGMVAMQMALDFPSRVEALGLICTSATMDREAWAVRVDTVRRHGTSEIAQMAVGRFLSPAFSTARPEVAARLRDGIVSQSDDGYAGAAAAIRDMDLARRIGDLKVPTLVVTAKDDISTPATGHGEFLLAQIPGACHAEVSGGHLPPIEAPDALADALTAFLSPLGGHAREGRT